MGFRDMPARWREWRERRAAAAAEEASADADADRFISLMRDPGGIPVASLHAPKKDPGRHRRPAEPRHRIAVVAEKVSQQPVPSPPPGRQPGWHISGVPGLAELVAAAGPAPEPENTQPRDPTVIADAVRPAIAGDLLPYLDGLPGYDKE